ncbi:LamG-like jellyroll fold domain-containing protein [Terrabacter sp. BE26]|uniref:LamG-like jellyroll fold domain-containing protein n=1 Tax=Terrabacter sp. BE26 TaxID=2898152 RepID=UPI0035BE287E
MKRILLLGVGASTLTVGLAAAPVGAAAVAASGPATVALWHLDEPSGATTAVDSSGRGHNGAIGASVLVGVPGQFGSAYEFPGPDAKVTVPTADDLNPYLSPLTLSAYLSVPSSLAGGDYNVVQKGQATAVGGAYKLEIVGNAGSSKFGYPDCAFNSPGGYKNRVYGPKRINDGAWHQVECHLTATQVYVTVDGRSGPVAARTVGSIANSVALTIGGKPNNTHYYQGRADEVSISVG